jgi:hypothetical protein
MSGLKRGVIVLISDAGDNRFIVSDILKNTLLKSDDDYDIYFGTIQFHEDGSILARYLGDYTGILNDDSCIAIKYDKRMKKWVAKDGGRTFEAARMASIKNKDGINVIIPES